MIDVVFYLRRNGEWRDNIFRVTLDRDGEEYLGNSEYHLHKEIGSWRPWDLIGRSPKPASQAAIDRFAVDYFRKSYGSVWMSCIPTDLVEGVLSKMYLDFELEHWSCDNLLEKFNVDFPWMDPFKLSVLGHPLCVFESGIVRIGSMPARKIFHVNISDGRRESVFLSPIRRNLP